MRISAKNQIKGKVTSVIHGSSYSQVSVEQTDADGNFIPAQFYKGKIDVANALKNNNVEVPAEVEQALKDFKVYNSKKGFMYDLMKDIYSVDGVENQLKILKNYETQIADINAANKTLLKFTLHCDGVKQDIKWRKL